MGDEGGPRRLAPSTTAGWSRGKETGEWEREKVMRVRFWLTHTHTLGMDIGAIWSAGLRHFCKASLISVCL